jgi:hypothetical protein
VPVGRIVTSRIWNLLDLVPIPTLPGADTGADRDSSHPAAPDDYPGTSGARVEASAF